MLLQDRAEIKNCETEMKFFIFNILSKRAEVVKVWLLQVVIPKATLREDEENEKRASKYSEYFSEYYLQIVQLGVIVCLIIFL